MSLDVKDGQFDLSQEISLNDLLAAQRDTEIQAQHQANAAAETENQCSFRSGYIGQSIYSCRTCRLKTGKQAGICRGCAFNCHLDHELDELFHKRMFRCDCSTEKFKDAPQCDCQMEKQEDKISSLPDSEEKPAILEELKNTKNKYGQNFSGKYCYCNGLYLSATDTMLQCTRCEDWFHDRCLQNKLSEEEDEASELYCKNCIEKAEFLAVYFKKCSDIAAKAKSETEKEHPKVSESSTENGVPEPAVNSESSEKKEPENGPDESNKRPAGGNIDSSAQKKSKTETGACSKPIYADLKATDGEFFFDADWRDHLCRCTDCLKMYDDCDMHYLVEDPPSYEDEHINYMNEDLDASSAEAPSNEFSLEQLAGQALSNLPRAQVAETIGHFQVYMEAIRSGLKAWEENHPGETVPKEVVDQITKDAKFEANQARSSSSGVF